MSNPKIRVQHRSLPDLSLDKLRQLRRLNLGLDGLMLKPVRLSIAYKRGKPLPLSIVVKMHKSLVSFIEIDDKIVSWGLLLSEDEEILQRRCINEKVQGNKIQYEIHLYTHREYRGRGFATKIAKSIKRKHPRTKFLAYWDDSSIFCKLNLVKLQDKDKEKSIKMRPRRVQRMS